jgi:hypothetical protein
MTTTNGDPTVTITTTPVSGDVHTADAGERFMDATAATLGEMVNSIDQSRGNLTGLGVKGASIELLGTLHDQATNLASAATAAAARFAAHRQVADDELGDDLGDTQDGRYLGNQDR